MNRRRLVATASAPILLIAGLASVRALSNTAPTATAQGQSQGPKTRHPVRPSRAIEAMPPTPSSADAPVKVAVSAQPAPASPAKSRPAITGPIGPNPPPATSRDTFTTTTRVLLPVKVQSQLPMLPNGCEATSLSMLLAAVGAPTSKVVLAHEQPTDPRQPVFATAHRDLTRIATWGDPERGFVGRVTGNYGYSIYHTPLARLLNSKLPGRARDLTGGSFQDLIKQVDAGTPVLVWNTITLRPTNRWVTWTGPNGPVHATFDEHAVLLVGHTATKLIINNPLSGRQETVDPEPFINAWRQLGRQALTVGP